MNKQLLKEIMDLCEVVMYESEDRYHEWLQDHEDDGKDHEYSLAASIHNELAALLMDKH